MHFLEVLALCWLVVERGADGLEGVLGSQGAVEGHLINNDGRIHLGSLALPLLVHSFEDEVVLGSLIDIDCVEESRLNTFLNHINVNCQCLHHFVALFFGYPMLEKLMHPLDILKEE